MSAAAQKLKKTAVLGACCPAVSGPRNTARGASLAPLATQASPGPPRVPAGGTTRPVTGPVAPTAPSLGPVNSPGRRELGAARYVPAQLRAGRGRARGVCARVGVGCRVLSFRPPRSHSTPFTVRQTRPGPCARETTARFQNAFTGPTERLHCPPGAAPCPSSSSPRVSDEQGQRQAEEGVSPSASGTGAESPSRLARRLTQRLTVKSSEAPQPRGPWEWTRRAARSPSGGNTPGGGGLAARMPRMPGEPPEGVRG